MISRRRLGRWSGRREMQIGMMVSIGVIKCIWLVGEAAGIVGPIVGRVHEGLRRGESLVRWIGYRDRGATEMLRNRTIEDIKIGIRIPNTTKRTRPTAQETDHDQTPAADQKGNPDQHQDRNIIETRQLRPGTIHAMAGTGNTIIKGMATKDIRAKIKTGKTGATRQGDDWSDC